MSLRSVVRGMMEEVGYDLLRDPEDYRDWGVLVGVAEEYGLAVVMEELRGGDYDSVDNWSPDLLRATMIEGLRELRPIYGALLSDLDLMNYANARLELSPGDHDRMGAVAADLLKMEVRP